MDQQARAMAHLNPTNLPAELSHGSRRAELPALHALVELAGLSGDDRRRREAAHDAVRAPRCQEFRLERGEIDAAVRRLGDHAQLGARLAPGQDVGVMLIRADQHHDARARGDPLAQAQQRRKPVSPAVAPPPPKMT